MAPINIKYNQSLPAETDGDNFPIKQQLYGLCAKNIQHMSLLDSKVRTYDTVCMSKVLPSLNTLEAGRYLDFLNACF
jgi:hypothetical protein